MKNKKLVILMSLLSVISAVNAEEPTAGSEDFVAICTEQAKLSGVEEESELQSYIKDCVDSYSGVVEG